MTTDPIADMINGIKNGQAVFKTTAKTSFSNLKYEIAKVLENNGWVEKVEKKGKKTTKTIEITLKYEDNKPVISNIKKISKPGQRIYIPASKIRKVRDGFGMSIISTPKGIMNNYQARKANLGGEILIEVY